jgi:serine/threonine protein kinase
MSTVAAFASMSLRKAAVIPYSAPKATSSLKDRISSIAHTILQRVSHPFSLQEVSTKLASVKQDESHLLATYTEEKALPKTSISKAYSFVKTPLQCLLDTAQQLPSQAMFSLPKQTHSFILDVLLNKSINKVKRLGKGSQASVYSMQIGDRKGIAAKQLSKDSAIDAEKAFKKETAIYMSLRSSHVVTVQAISEEVIYLDEMPEGSLETLLHSDLSDSQLCKYLLDIVEGLIDLHAHGYTYNDLKAANVLISKGSAKLCDFGLASATGSYNQEGSPCSVAPELQILVKDPKTPRVFSNQSDVWSLGVLIFQMITGGNYPYPRPRSTENPLVYENLHTYLPRIIQKTLNKPCDEAAVFDSLKEEADYVKIEERMQKRDPKQILRSLVVKCLHGNPDKRITLPEVKQLLQTQLTRFKPISECVIS